MKSASHRVLLFASLQLVSFALSFRLFGASSYTCALSNGGVGGAEVAYRLRGNRCEGLFVAPIAGEIVLRLLGFHLGDPTYPLGAPDDSPVNVPIAVRGVPKGTAVSLRLSSLDWRTHYHMDTDLTGGAAAFQWDTEILRRPQVRLESRNVASVACTNKCRPDATTRFYPVTVGTPAKGATLTPTLVLDASVALSQLTFVVTHAGKKLPEQTVSSEFAAHEPIFLLLSQVVSGDNDIVIVGSDASGERVASWWGRLALP